MENPPDVKPYMHPSIKIIWQKDSNFHCENSWNISRRMKFKERKNPKRYPKNEFDGSHENMT